MKIDYSKLTTNHHPGWRAQEEELRSAYDYACKAFRKLPDDEESWDAGVLYGYKLACEKLLGLRPKNETE